MSSCIPKPIVCVDYNVLMLRNSKGRSYNLLFRLSILAMAVADRKTATQLGLLSLPAELRNDIYNLSLPKGHKFVIGPWRPNTQHLQPPLTGVCKQIRDETLPMFAAKNCFRLKATTGGSSERDSHFISPTISCFLERIEIEICPYSSAYSVIATKDFHGIWTCHEGNRAFHLPPNHMEIWTKWLQNLAAHQDDEGSLRCEDLTTMIRWLQN